MSIPFRRSHSVCLSDALKQYISEKYDQHPDMFARDLDLVDALRADAVISLEAHMSGVRRLTQYAAQLVWIGGKFPIDVSILFIVVLVYCEILTKARLGLSSHGTHL